MNLLLTRPWSLLIVLVAIEFVLLEVWWWRRDRWSVRLVWIGLAAIPVLSALSYLVVTPRERIIALCHELAVAVESGEMLTIRRHLAGDFEAADLSASEFLDRVEQTLTRYDVIEPRLGDFEVTFPGDGVGVVTFHVTCRIDSGSFDRLPTRWRVTLRRSNDLWVFTTVETIPVPPLNARNLRELLR